jgi:hypothetical protein
MIRKNPSDNLPQLDESAWAVTHPPVERVRGCRHPGDER